jgi:hypothetical protein
VLKARLADCACQIAHLHILVETKAMMSAKKRDRISIASRPTRSLQPLSSYLTTSHFILVIVVVIMVVNQFLSSGLISAQAWSVHKK